MIYTGKGSAFTGYRSAAKPSQAEMHGMREVFPEAVAYAAVQVRLNYIIRLHFLKHVLRPTMAFLLSMVGILKIDSSNWMFFMMGALGCSLMIPTIHGLSIRCNS